MMSHTIDAARESGLFDRIVVSTEDAEIADLAHGLEIEVDRRPEKLATDQAHVTDVCLDFLKRERSAGRTWDVMSCLYATAPMRTAADIRATAALIEPGRCDFAMAVTRYPLPPHQALKLETDGVLLPMWPELIGLRASELPTLVVDNGSTYVVDTVAFELHRTFYGPKLCGYEMPRERSVDIDTREDFEYALRVASDRNKVATPRGRAASDG